MRYHAKERPYKCDMCAYTSSESGAVKRHRRQHTCEALAICDFPGCSYTATDFSNLTRHKRIHTGEKPFACPHCPHTSAQSASLRAHIQRRHSAARAFVCSQCCYSAKTGADLKKHETKQHK